MLLLREIAPADLLPSYALARQFNLYNFPLNARIIKEKIDISQKSFRDELNKMQSAYLFVLEKWPERDLIGVSQIKGMNGSISLPDYYFSVDRVRVGRRKLICLTLKAQHFGHSELGGLLLNKDFRGQGTGRFLSLGRLLFMGLRPECFQDVVYAQLAPVMTPSGDSVFWEVLGKNFTGLSFEKANEYSRRDQKFVPQFYPTQRICIYEDAQFFKNHPYLNNTPQLEVASQVFEPEEMHDVAHKLNVHVGDLPMRSCLLVVSSIEKLYLGQVGEETRAARYILGTQGLSYQNTVHCFDGGPHLMADVDKLEIVRHLKPYVVSAQILPPHATHTYMWLAFMGPKGFRAAPVHYRLEGQVGEADAALVLPQAAHDALGLKPGDRVHGYEHTKATRGDVSTAT